VLSSVAPRRAVAALSHSAVNEVEALWLHGTLGQSVPHASPEERSNVGPRGSPALGICGQLLVPSCAYQHPSPHKCSRGVLPRLALHIDPTAYNESSAQHGMAGTCAPCSGDQYA
jgi:hypothetical protein